MTGITAATVFEKPSDLIGAEGRDLGTTAWLELDELAVQRFTAATGQRPSAPGEPVPPMMVLSLTNYFLPQLLEVRGASSGINYGTGAVRFGRPVRAGDRLRARARILEAAEVAGGVQTTVEITVEAEDGDEAACVVESLSRWMA